MSHNRPLRALLAAALLTTAMLAAGFLPGGAPAARAIAAPYSPDEVVARLAPQDGAAIEEVNADYGTATIRELRVTPGTFLLSTPPGEDAAQTIARMRGDRRLAFVEPNYLSGAPEANPRKIRVWGGESSAPRFEQYALDRLGISEAHATTRGAGVTVAVIDTGVQLDHPALAANLLPNGYDFVDGDDDPSDVGDGLDDDEDGQVDEAIGHGSHVAGIVLLVAPEASILPIRALNADGVGEVYGVAMAIEYAVAHGADVINLSLGTELQTDLLTDVVRAAAQAGVLVVAAAGNTSSAAPEYPAADPCAVGVTAVDYEDRLAPQASYGQWVDLAAPGESIYSALEANGYGWWSGTSMAAPFVSGQAALLFAARPDLNVRQLTGVAFVTSGEIDSSGSGRGREARRIDIGQSVSLAATGRYFSSRMSFIAPECVISVVSSGQVAETGSEP